MSKLLSALVAGAFALVPVTPAVAQDKAPAKTPAKTDCKAAETKAAACKKSADMSADCKKAEAAMAECAKAAPKKKEKKGGC
jgi:hypothetical protein